MSENTGVKRFGSEWRGRVESVLIYLFGDEAQLIDQKGIGSKLGNQSNPIADFDCRNFFQEQEII